MLTSERAPSSGGMGSSATKKLIIFRQITAGLKIEDFLCGEYFDPVFITEERGASLRETENVKPFSCQNWFEVQRLPLANIIVYIHRLITIVAIAM